MPHPKIIFLDIDGVLNNFEAFRDKHGMSPCWYIDKRCVDRLNQIIKATDAVCVLSSTWKRSWNLEALEQWLTELFGFTGKIIDSTPRYSTGIRGNEIEVWLQENDCESFIILDDEGDMGSLLHRLVQTYNEDGLKESL